MAVNVDVPALVQLEAGQLLLGILQLAGDIVGERRVALAGVAADDETGFAGGAAGGELEDVDALVLPGIGNLEIGFVEAIERHCVNPFPRILSESLLDKSFTECCSRIKAFLARSGLS